MTSRFSVPVAALAAGLLLAGCAGLPRERGYAEADALVATRRGDAPDWSVRLAPDATPAPLPDTPLTPDDAVRIAYTHSPRVLQAYARLGIGRAGLEEARRFANPSFGYGRLSPDGSDSHKITRSLTLGIGNALLLPSRTRLATGEFERLQQAVADELLVLAADTESAWYAAVGAAQVAAMRDVVADASEAAADLAQRFFDAGNINRLQLEQERAAAAQARIDAVRAFADARRARAALAELLGLPLDGTWRTLDRLPAPLDTTFDADALTTLALDQRLDLAAARRGVALREDALGVTRRWRWFGDIELGYERETEPDGGRMRGPSLSLSLALPIFDQGQGALGRAQADLLDARAALDATVLDVHNGVRLGIDRLALSRDIAARYRDVLVPGREAIVARTQEQVNFMLRGVFELIEAKQAEYDAYEAYLDAVRDYWTERAALRRIVGGALPGDADTPAATLGVDAVLPKADEAHDHHGMDHAAPAQDDPHAHHRKQAATETPPADAHAAHRAASEHDPHAAHRAPAGKDDPHAAHRTQTPDEDPHAAHRHATDDKPTKPTDDPHAGHHKHDTHVEPATDGDTP